MTRKKPTYSKERFFSAEQDPHDANAENPEKQLYIEEPEEPPNDEVREPPRSEQAVVVDAGLQREEKEAARKPRRRASRFFGSLGAMLWSIFQYLLVVAVLCLLVGFAAYKSMQFFISGANVAAREVKVPNLSGMDLRSALLELQDVDLTLEMEKEESSEAVPEGSIIRQRPVPETTVKTRTPVKVTVSLGPSLLPIPNLRGMNYIDAEIKLREAEFEVGDQAWIHDSRVEKGVVLAQDPPHGSRLPLQSKVNMLISAGPPLKEYEMPALVGLTLPEAQRELKKLNLSIQEMSQAESAGTQAGEIMQQSPPAGHGVTPDTPIKVTVATGL